MLKISLNEVETGKYTKIKPVLDITLVKLQSMILQCVKTVVYIVIRIRTFLMIFSCSLSYLF